MNEIPFQQRSEPCPHVMDDCPCSLPRGHAGLHYDGIVYWPDGDSDQPERSEREAVADVERALYELEPEFGDDVKRLAWKTLRGFVQSRVRPIRGAHPPDSEAVEKDDEGRPYPCGAFVSSEPGWFCRLESDHEGEHEWVQRGADSEAVAALKERLMRPLDDAECSAAEVVFRSLKKQTDPYALPKTIEVVIRDRARRIALAGRTGGGA